MSPCSSLIRTTINPGNNARSKQRRMLKDVRGRSNDLVPQDRWSHWITWRFSTPPFPEEVSPGVSQAPVSHQNAAQFSSFLSLTEQFTDWTTRYAWHREQEGFIVKMKQPGEWFLLPDKSETFSSIKRYWTTRQDNNKWHNQGSLFLPVGLSIPFLKKSEVVIWVAPAKSSQIIIRTYY